MQATVNKPFTQARRAGRWIPFASLLFGGLALLLHLLPASAGIFEYHREAILQGELWRLLTGHFTHITHEHLIWDLAAFLCLGMICERLDRKAFLVCLLSSSLAVSLAVFIALPDMYAYRGLSGIDSALLGMAAILQLRAGINRHEKGRVLMVGLVALLFVTKICMECFSGSPVFVQATAGEFESVPLAHITGAVVGLLSGWKGRGLK